MGDCVMAFWAMPVGIQEPVRFALKRVMETAVAVRKINEEQRANSNARNS